MIVVVMTSVWPLREIPWDSPTFFDYLNFVPLGQKLNNSVGHDKHVLYIIDNMKGEYMYTYEIVHHYSFLYYSFQWKIKARVTIGTGVVMD